MRCPSEVNWSVVFTDAEIIMLGVVSYDELIKVNIACVEDLGTLVSSVKYQRFFRMSLPIFFNTSTLQNHVSCFFIIDGHGVFTPKVSMNSAHIFQSPGLSLVSSFSPSLFKFDLKVSTQACAVSSGSMVSHGARAHTAVHGRHLPLPVIFPMVIRTFLNNANERLSKHDKSSAPLSSTRRARFSGKASARSIKGFVVNAAHDMLPGCLSRFSCPQRRRLSPMGRAATH